MIRSFNKQSILNIARGQQSLRPPRRLPWHFQNPCLAARKQPIIAIDPPCKFSTPVHTVEGIFRFHDL